jgi:probable phosphoglycerate mutase
VVRGIHLGLDARAMFLLPKPQDAFFRLVDGREERIEAPL